MAEPGWDIPQLARLVGGAAVAVIALQSRVARGEQELVMAAGPGLEAALGWRIEEQWAVSLFRGKDVGPGLLCLVNVRIGVDEAHDRSLRCRSAVVEHSIGAESPCQKRLAILPLPLVKTMIPLAPAQGERVSVTKKSPLPRVGGEG